jgi:hypothetical protein
VFSYPVLGEIIGANAFTAITGSHLALAVFSGFVPLLLLFSIQESGAQHLQGFGLVLVLRFFVLAADH